MRVLFFIGSGTWSTLMWRYVGRWVTTLLGAQSKYYGLSYYEIQLYETVRMASVASLFAQFGEQFSILCPIVRIRRKSTWVTKRFRLRSTVKRPKEDCIRT